MSKIKCYFDNEPEYAKAMVEYEEKYKSRVVFDITEDTVPAYSSIKFYCDNKIFHERNVQDLFSIIENCITDIDVSYVQPDGSEYSYITFSDSCDPINKYEFTKNQIEYIRQKRKSILCNPIIQAVINRWHSILEEGLEKIKELNIDCSDLLLGAIYCPDSKNKNDFMLAVIKMCETIEKRLILYAGEEDLNFKVFNKLLEKISHEDISNLLNERGETILDIVGKSETNNNKQYKLDDIKTVSPLLFTAIVTQSLKSSDRFNLVKKLVNNGANVNMKLKGYSPLRMAVAIYTPSDSNDESIDYSLEIIKLLKENGAV